MKIVIFFLGLFLSLFAYTTSNIIKIDKDIITVEYNKKIKPFESAFVARKLGDNETLISECEVLKDTSKLKCKPFTMLEQPSLSMAKDKPKIGDIVYFGLLEKTAVIFAPNFQSYQQAKQKLQNYNIISPDIMAIDLYDDNNPEPAKEDFQKFCKQNFVGTLFFALRDNLYKVDCLSFKKIDTLNIRSNDKKFQKPFFNKVPEIEKSWYNIGADKLKNFSLYYKKLFEAKDD